MSTARSITKSIDIRVAPAVAFRFLNDPMNWPQWAIVNMKSVKPGKDGWYETETRRGKGNLKMIGNEALGILDHHWKDSQASWVVPARVVIKGDGCTYLMTFFQPPVMDNGTFDSAAIEIDVELRKLKEILEK